MSIFFYGFPEIKEREFLKMKKQLKIKSTNGIGLQAFGVMSAILATLVSFAYLMPEDSTAETVQASATGTTTAVTTASVVDSSSSLTTSATHTTHTTAVRTMTSTSTATTVITTTTSSAVLTTTTTSTTSATTTSTSTSESTTISSETQTSPVLTSATEISYFSEPALTTAEVFTEKALESIVITTDKNSQNYDEYYDHVHDQDCEHEDYEDYEDNYDDGESEIYGEKIYLGTFRITHYCPCSQCCGEYTGLTASGTVATAERTVSASDQFEFGTQLEIDGIVYTVEDRGGFSYDTIDIFCDSHEEALEKGTYYADVYIVE